MSENRVQFSGGAMLIFGLVFTVVGATSNSSFLWIGIPFLLIGLFGLGYAMIGRK